MDTLSDVFQGQAISVGKTAAGYHDNIYYPANKEAAAGDKPKNAGSNFPDVESVDSKSSDDYAKQQGDKPVFFGCWLPATAAFAVLIGVVVCLSSLWRIPRYGLCPTVCAVCNVICICTAAVRTMASAIRNLGTAAGAEVRTRFILGSTVWAYSYSASAAVYRLIIIAHVEASSLRILIFTRAPYFKACPSKPYSPPTISTSEMSSILRHIRRISGISSLEMLPI